MKHFLRILAAMVLYVNACSAQVITLAIKSSIEDTMQYTVRIGKLSFKSDATGIVHIEKEKYEQLKAKSIAIQFVDKDNSIFYMKNILCFTKEATKLFDDTNTLNLERATLSDVAQACSKYSVLYFRLKKYAYQSSSSTKG